MHASVQGEMNMVSSGGQKILLVIFSPIECSRQTTTTTTTTTPSPTLHF
jgi:hypothetical protein